MFADSFIICKLLLDKLNNITRVISKIKWPRTFSVPNLPNLKVARNKGIWIFDFAVTLPNLKNQMNSIVDNVS